jgi:hypothetical protein
MPAYKVASPPPGARATQNLAPINVNLDMPPILVANDTPDARMIRTVPQSSVVGERARKLGYDRPSALWIRTCLSKSIALTREMDVVAARRPWRRRTTVSVVLTSTFSHLLNGSFRLDDDSAHLVARAATIMVMKPAVETARRAKWPRKLAMYCHVPARGDMVTAELTRCADALECSIFSESIIGCRHTITSIDSGREAGDTGI